MKKLLIVLFVLVSVSGFCAGTTKIETGAVLVDAYQTSNFVLAAASESKIIFGSVVLNPQGAYNASTGEFTVPVTGRYRVDAQAVIGYTTTGSGSATIVVYKATTAISRDNEIFIPYLNAYVKTTGEYDLTAGDVISMSIRQISDGALTSYSGTLGRDNNRLTIRLLP